MSRSLSSDLSIETRNGTEQSEIEISRSFMVADDILEATDETNNVEMPNEVLSEAKKSA